MCFLFFFHGFCMSWLDSPCHNWHFFGGKGADLYKDIVLSLANYWGGGGWLTYSSSRYPVRLKREKTIILED